MTIGARYGPPFQTLSLQSRLDTPAGVLLFLDTVEAGIHSGVYCKQHCHWLERALTEAEDEPVYLFLHHPPMEIGMPRLDQYRILRLGGSCGSRGGRE